MGVWQKDKHKPWNVIVENYLIVDGVSLLLGGGVLVDAEHTLLAVDHGPKQCCSVLPVPRWVNFLNSEKIPVINNLIIYLMRHGERKKESERETKKDREKQRRRKRQTKKDSDKEWHRQRMT